MDNTNSERPDELIENTESASSKPRTSGSKSRGKSGHRKKRADAGRYLIARLLGLICLVLVIFEGNVIYRLFTHRVGTNVEIMNTGNNAQTEGLLQNSADSDTALATKEETPTTGGNASVVALAGGASDEDISSETSPSSLSSSSSSASSALPVQSSEYIDNPKVLKYREPPVDDTFFNNAVFIGDSRMEGFRNASGITQGTFLTSVGLAVNDMDRQIIQTADGNISVYQGLSGHQYDKIYLMLGANDLGYYPWEDFLPAFESVLETFHELQPRACIYICSVIYVDETKIEPGFEYDNNDNVRTINGYLLDACDDFWYCYYLNLNEIFSDGYGGLIIEASSDGIHLYPDYLEMMLDYLRTHYLLDEEFEQEIAKHPEDIANAEPETEAEKKKQDIIEEDDDSGGDEDVGAN